MLKKIFNPKRKRQDPGRHNTSKITMDPASVAILSRHFSPLSSRAKSPSDLLDIVGYPVINKTLFSQSSPELLLYSTRLQLNKDEEEQDLIEIQQPRQPRLTIRNNTTPMNNNKENILLLETSREDKTLVEDEEKEQVYRLNQKLLEIENERDFWRQKLQDYIQREEQMRKIIHENQVQINQFKFMYNTTHSRDDYEEEEEEDDSSIIINQQDNDDDRYDYCYQSLQHDRYYHPSHQQYNLKRRYTPTTTSHNYNLYYPRHHHHQQQHHHYSHQYYYKKNV